MKTQQDIKSVSDRADRHNRIIVKGFENLTDIVQEKQYSQKIPAFSEYQNQMYKRCLYGIKAYSEEELNNMCLPKRNRIKKVHNKTQKLLNLWKQEKLIKLTDTMFSLFGHSKFVKDLIDITAPSESFLCDLSFKDLNIQKTDIVDRLFKEGLLPTDFYNK